MKAYTAEGNHVFGRDGPSTKRAPKIIVSQKDGEKRVDQGFKERSKGRRQKNHAAVSRRIPGQARKRDEQKPRGQGAARDVRATSGNKREEGSRDAHQQMKRRQGAPTGRTSSLDDGEHRGESGDQRDPGT